MTGQSTQSELFRDDEADTFAVLDGASWPGVINALAESGAEHQCLMRGDLNDQMRAVAPYLVRLTKGSPILEGLLGERAGKHQGILVRAIATFPILRNHLRDLTTAMTPDGERMRFRYYDPRVLTAFLPTCDPQQLEEFFGPAVSFFAEDEDDPSQVRRFWREDARLRSELTSVDKQQGAPA